MSTRLAEERDRAEADSREKETKYLALSRALQVNTTSPQRTSKNFSFLISSGNCCTSFSLFFPTSFLNLIYLVTIFTLSSVCRMSRTKRRIWRGSTSSCVWRWSSL